MNHNTLRPSIPQLALYSLTLFLLFSLCHMVTVWPPFYEDSRYLYYLVSFLHDWDFNIINQVPPEERWLVTDTLFHPDMHHNVQTPFLLFTHLLELLAGTWIPATPAITYRLASYLLHVISLLSGFLFCRKTGEYLGYKIEETDFYLFLFSSSLFYFSLLYYNVLEIFTFPLLSYLLYCLIKLREQARDFNPLALGLSISMLCYIKVTYVIIALYVAAVYLASALQRKQYKQLASFIMPSILFLTAYTANAFLRHHAIFDQLHTFRYIMDFSLYNLVSTYPVKFFGSKGLFSANPALIVSFIGLGALFYYQKTAKLLTSLDLLVLLLWLCFSLFQISLFIGNTTEDHLVGRTYFTSLPLLFLGYSSAIALTKNRRTLAAMLRIFLPVSIIWAMTMTIIFILNDLHGHFSYAFSRLFDFNILSAGWGVWRHGIVDNFSIFLDNFWYIVAFFSLVFIVSLVFLRLPIRSRLFEVWIIVGATLYLFMTLLNQNYAPLRIEEYVSRGLYKDKVIGNGDELFAYDYVLDIMNVIYLSGNAEQKQLIVERKNKYFDFIRSQVIQSTAAFDRELAEKSLHASIYYKKEHKMK